MVGHIGETSSAIREYERQLSADEKYERLLGQETVSTNYFVAGLQGEFCSEMNRRYGSIIVRNGLLKESLALAFHNDCRVAFRASWALEWAYLHNRDAFAPYCDTFFDNFLRVTNPSVLRHYNKILHDMLHRQLFVPDDSRVAQIAEKTFDMLVDGKTKSAVKIWAAEILYELSPRIDWVRENLEDIIRHQIETMPTPAILNHYGKLLKRMAGEK
jgi:hypothetical protein